MSIRRSSKGTTLLETLLSTAIFSLLVVALFAFYAMGKMKWNTMYLRYNLQSEARRAMGDVERDLRKTDYSSVDVYSNPRVTPDGWTGDVPRWAVCSVSLSDWSNPGNFDPVSGKPLWNQYVIYMATTETNRGGYGPQGGAGSGRFLKIVVNFASTPTNPLPLHFPAFLPTVDWVNNEFSVIQKEERVGGRPMLQAGFAPLGFPGILLAQSSSSPSYSPTYSPTNPSASPSWDPNMGNPSPSSWPSPQPTSSAYTTMNNDATSGLDAQFNSDLSGVISATNPPFAMNYLKVSFVADVFAFRVDKDDLDRVVGVTYKTRGFVNRSESGGAAYESRQLGVYVQPGVNHGY